MDFLADENFPLASVRRLREEGHDARAVSEDSAGIADEQVLWWASREGRLLLTFDSDYGGLLYGQSAGEYQPEAGVVYFRLEPLYPEEPADHLLELLQRPELTFSGQLTVVERERVRQRPLPE